MTPHADRDLGPLREMQDQRSKDSFPPGVCVWGGGGGGRGGGGGGT